VTLELANEDLLLEVRHNGCCRDEVVRMLDEDVGISVIYIMETDAPFPDIELRGGTVSTLVDTIAQVNCQIVRIGKRRCQQSLHSEKA
jgi:hypothetical protein